MNMLMNTGSHKKGEFLALVIKLLVYQGLCSIQLVILLLISLCKFMHSSADLQYTKLQPNHIL